MPHQCLKCGKVFLAGSSELLKGCPDCKGNRFFYTKEPLNEEERQAVIKEVGEDINSTLMEIIDSKGNKIVDESGKWINIKPKDLRKALKKHLAEKEKIASHKKEDIEVITDEKYRIAAIEKIKSEADQSDTPETIGIEKPGKYKIDIKGLLEEQPIVIQKDGSYTIHLPSVFKMINKEKKE